MVSATHRENTLVKHLEVVILELVSAWKRIGRLEVSQEGWVRNATNGQFVGIHMRDGYAYVSHNKAVHRLVAEAWCKDYCNTCVVHHRDGDKLNNHFENLLCTTPLEHKRLHTMPGNYKGARIIAVRFPASELEKLEAVCKKTGLEKSAVIRQAVSLWSRMLGLQKGAESAGSVPSSHGPTATPPFTSER